MTIAVTIENTDNEKSIEVIERNRTRDGKVSDGSPYTVGPGLKSTFHCYLLRDLIIREVDPTGRG